MSPRMIRKVLSALLPSCLLLSTSACAMRDASHEPSTTLRIGAHQVRAQVARTLQERETGLMGRTFLPQNSGMLFVFKHPQKVCMWMKNTPMPLSVAFATSDGVITNIAKMAPETLTAHCSTKAVSYAVEMNINWFQLNSVGPGDKIRASANPSRP